MFKSTLILASSLLAFLSFGCSAPEPSGPPPSAPDERAERDVELMGKIRGTLAEPNPLKRIERLVGVMLTLDESDVPEVAAVVDAGAMGLGGAELDILVRWWASYEPDRAARWAISESPPSDRVIAIDAAIETRSKVDPVGSLAFVRELEGRNSADADVARRAMIRGWYLSGEPGVEGYILSLGHDKPQQLALTAMTRVVAQHAGAEGLAEWLEDLEDDGHKFKLTAYRRAAAAMYQADLEYAKKWCEEVCDGPYGEYVRGLLAREWAEDDGPAAMAWLASASPSKDRDRAVQNAFMGWRARDEEGLTAWIDEMGPEGVEPWFAPAAPRIAMWKAWDYPLEAYRWASWIEDDEARELAYISITRRFREVDEAGAEAWLEQSPLSEEAREKARTFPPKWKGRGARPYPPAPKG